MLKPIFELEMMHRADEPKFNRWLARLNKGGKGHMSCTCIRGKKTIRGPLLCLILSTIFIGCTRPEKKFSLVLDPMELNTSPGSGAPILSLGPNGEVYISWTEPHGVAGNRMRFARFVRGARAWSKPIQITEGDDWFVNWTDVPSVAVGKDKLMTAHWLAYSGVGKYAYGVRISLSSDVGRSWSAPIWLYEENAHSEHDFVSLMPLQNGSVEALWLDGRQNAGGRNVMSLRARTVTPNGTLGPEHVLDDMTCDCCPTTAVDLPGGGLLALYRNRTQDEIRDIYSVRYIGGKWEAPRPVHADGWHVAGCPVNGPAVDVAGTDIIAAWFTAAGDTARVEAAFSSDDGRTFFPPTRLDLGFPAGRVDAAGMEDGSALILWLEGTSEGEAAGIYVRRLTPDGRSSAAIRLIESTTGRSSGYPRIARSGRDFVLAWTESGEGGGVRTAFLSID